MNELNKMSAMHIVNEETSLVRVVIATHKKYRMPDDPMYLPLHVGAEGKIDAQGKSLDLGYIKDNTGVNISELNASFCELTGLYWAWKNLDADYIGMSHYRRHFTSGKNKDPFRVVLREVDIANDLGKIKVFVPKKRHYVIETIYSHYEHTHYINQLNLTRDIMAKKCPEYLEAYNKVINQTYGYMFNMLIMEHGLLDKYCTWMFDILFELKDRIGMPELSAYQGRFYGRVSEIIFNVWIEKMITDGNIKKPEVKELSWSYMERINRIKKIIAFLKAKFFNIKYEGSF